MIDIGPETYTAPAGTVWRDPLTGSTWRVNRYEDLPPNQDFSWSTRVAWCNLVDASPDLPQIWRDWADSEHGMSFYPHAVAAAIRRNGGVSL